ncbi:hypothetical protein VP01_269g6 [Puccinia sorghi]|uniref:Uncharacterized protein n=1 Tax=Puccinia sorghi TaxID=27349 RepID=A0A0L6V3P6_9BASI|nr:hypothetical protein VP01_269g6 [Puccinia sorghi]
MDHDAVILVSFDHALSPTVEWSFPASLVGRTTQRRCPRWHGRNC